MPFTRGRWLSSLEKGQRLVEPAFFSLEIFTTQGWAFSTAFTTGVPAETLAAWPGHRRPARHADKGEGQQGHDADSIPSRHGQWHVTVPRPVGLYRGSSGGRHTRTGSDPIAIPVLTPL